MYLAWNGGFNAAKFLESGIAVRFLLGNHSEYELDIRAEDAPELLDVRIGSVIFERENLKRNFL